MKFKKDYTITPEGVISQKNPSPYAYGEEYLNSYKKIKEKCILLSEIRMNFLNQHAPNLESLLDFGSGTGEFLEYASKSVERVFSYDIIPKNFTFAHTLKDLEEVRGEQFDVVCFFDCLEHILDPKPVIKLLNTKYIYISLPWCHYTEMGEEWFMNWKHRKPDEHIHHFNDVSLQAYMTSVGYDLISIANIEDEVRIRYNKDLPNILTGIFKKSE